MSTTAQKSTQVSNGSAAPEVKNLPTDNAKLRIARFDFAQSGAGDAGSTVDLVNLGNGKVRIIPALSRLKFSAFGTSRTLDIGVTAYTKLDGSAQAAQTDKIDDGRDVSSAGSGLLGAGTNGLADGLDVESKSDIVVQAVVAGGTIPDGATLAGWIAYVRD